MKKCSSCGMTLNEGYCLTVIGSWPVTVTEKNYRGKKAGDIIGYACPKCGKIELYLHKKTKA